MRDSLKIGFSFGVTSGIITTLGLIVGLDAGTHSKTAVIGGILTIAIADAFSDALGIHNSEESDIKKTAKEIWLSTLSTFLAKFVFAMTFIVPIQLFPLSTAIIVSVIWGLFLLGILSCCIARAKKVKPWRVIAENLLLALVVTAATNYAGNRIGTMFGES